MIEHEHKTEGEFDDISSPEAMAWAGSREERAKKWLERVPEKIADAIIARAPDDNPDFWSPEELRRHSLAAALIDAREDIKDLQGYIEDIAMPNSLTHRVLER